MPKYFYTLSEGHAPAGEGGFLASDDEKAIETVHMEAQALMATRAVEAQLWGEGMRYIPVKL